MLIPPLWQTALVARGLWIMHEIGWLRGVVIGLLSVVVLFIMFLAFMRQVCPPATHAGVML